MVEQQQQRGIQKPLGETVYILRWLQKEKMAITQALRHTESLKVP